MINSPYEIKVSMLHNIVLINNSNVSNLKSFHSNASSKCGTKVADADIYQHQETPTFLVNSANSVAQTKQGVNRDPNVLVPAEKMVEIDAVSVKPLTYEVC